MEEAKADPSLSAVRTPGPVRAGIGRHSAPAAPASVQRRGRKSYQWRRSADSDWEEEAIAPVLLSASRHPVTESPLNSIIQELCPIKRSVEGLRVGSSSETEPGHSVTDILSFSFSENASLIFLIASLKAQPYYSSPCQTALGGHFHFCL